LPGIWKCCSGSCFKHFSSNVWCWKRFFQKLFQQTSEINNIEKELLLTSFFIKENKWAIDNIINSNNEKWNTEQADEARKVIINATANIKNLSNINKTQTQEALNNAKIRLDKILENIGLKQEDKDKNKKDKE
jgi:hypothetical protein